jgi:hypothetical protein
VTDKFKLRKLLKGASGEEGSKKWLELYKKAIKKKKEGSLEEKQLFSF